MKDYRPLRDEQAVLAWIQQSPIADKYFAGTFPLICKEVADNDVNKVYRIKPVNDGQSLLIKQALPHSAVISTGASPLEHSRIEYEVLQSQQRHCGERVARIWHYDPGMRVLILEDFSAYDVCSDGMTRQQYFPLFASHMAEFLAKSLFFGSDLVLGSEEKKAAVIRFCNPSMSRLQEELCFTQPLVEHPANHRTEGLETMVQQIREDRELYAEVLRLKRAYMTESEALLHGNLHGGTMLLTNDDTRVTDPEFGGYGPMGFDLGCVIAQLLIAAASQSYWANEADKRHQYRQWLLMMSAEFWERFAHGFRDLWDQYGNQEAWGSSRYIEHYLVKILRDALGFAGCEMIRRTIGRSQAREVALIADPDIAVTVGKDILILARTLLLEGRHATSIEGAFARLWKAQSD